MQFKKLFQYLLIASVSFSLAAEAEQKKVYKLRDAFNVKAQVHEKMTWDEFNELKVPLEREEFFSYVDKIESQKKAKALGIQVPITYFTSREKAPVAHLLAQLPCYVAKMTHLSWSDGLIIVKNGVNIITGKPTTPEEVEATLHKALDMKPRKGQPWALFNCKPGFMIQEYIPERNEAKVQTIFGKVIFGLWFKGETSKFLAPYKGTYDRDGKLVRGETETPHWWAHVVEHAEALAEGTDNLRVDFLIREDGTPLMSELEHYPEISWRNSEKEILMKAVKEGYKNIP